MAGDFDCPLQFIYQYNIFTHNPMICMAIENWSWSGAVEAEPFATMTLAFARHAMLLRIETNVEKTRNWATSNN